MKYVTPELEMIHFSPEDVLNGSTNPAVIPGRDLTDSTDFETDGVAL